MGYTHYWQHTRDFTSDEWTGLVDAFQDVIQAGHTRGLPLSFDNGDTICSQHSLLGEISRARSIGQFQVNGFGDQSCETFVLAQKGQGFDFCKTRGRGYDDVVTAMLIVAETRAPDKISVSSDGNPPEWKAGLDLARSALPKEAPLLRLPRSLRFENQWQDVLLRGEDTNLLLRRDDVACIVEGENVRALFSSFTGSSLQKRIEALKTKVQDLESAQQAAEIERYLQDIARAPDSLGGRVGHEDDTIMDFPIA